MKPFIFQFQESSDNFPIIDVPKMVYSSELNLSIDLKSGLPAINDSLMITESGTKTNDDEQSDTDRTGFNSFLITETGSYNNTEESDSDNHQKNFMSLLETHTGTRTDSELSDRD